MPDFDVTGIAQGIAAHIGGLVQGFVKTLLRPASASTLATTVLDLSRSKAYLIAENALLRHQPILLKRQSKRPKLSQSDRLHLLLLAKITRTWRQVLMIVQPATIVLIRRMAAENPLWGAERIRGELLKLDIQVAKRTIQKYLDHMLIFGERQLQRRLSKHSSTISIAHDLIRV